MTDTAAPSSTSSTSPMRRWLMFALRLAITGGLIAWVLTQSNVSEIFDKLASVHVGIWLAGAALAITAQSLQVINLRWTLHRVNDAVSADGVGARVPVMTATRAHALGVFANLFLPSAIGGDVLKSVALRRETSGVMAAASAVVLARAIGVLGLVLTAGIGLGATWNAFAALPALRSGVAAVLGSLSAAMAVAWFARRPLVRLGRRVCPRSLRPKMTPVFDTVEQLTLAAVLFPAAIGTAYSFCAVAWNGLFGIALGLDLSVWVYAFAVPTVYLVTLLPVTVQGIGLREVAYVQLLAAFAVGTNQAVPFALLVFSAPLVVGLTCGLFVTLTRPDPEASQQQPTQS